MQFSHVGWVASLTLGLTIAPLALPTIPAAQILLPSAAAQTAADQLAEANRLIEQGIQQSRTSQYRAAI